MHSLIPKGLWFQITAVKTLYKDNVRLVFFDYTKGLLPIINSWKACIDDGPPKNT